MTYRELYTALRRLDVETGSLPCLGCEWAQDCGIHGCRILRVASEVIRQLRHQNATLTAAIKAAERK